jgi:hypothetical protein
MVVMDYTTEMYLEIVMVTMDGSPAVAAAEVLMMQTWLDPATEARAAAETAVETQMVRRSARLTPAVAAVAPAALLVPELMVVRVSYL